MTDAKIEELRSEAKRQSLPGCGTFLNALELALKAIAYAESLTAKLSAIRDAGDEEVEDLAREAGNGIGSDYFRDKKGCNKAEEYLNRLEDIAISRGQQRDEVVGLLKWWVGKTRHGHGCHLDAVATNAGELGDNARRILEIVEGK